MIKAAFDRLRNHGFIARPGLKVGHNDATAAISERAVEITQKGYQVRGCVFFTEDAVKNRTPDGGYPICFGPVPTPNGVIGLPYEQCGKIIVETLLKCGVYAVWDGEPDHAIIVKEN